MEALSVYVVDTHGLFWYLKDPSRLSPAADAVFRLAETGNAKIIVPAIVVAELYFLTLKRGQPLLPSRLIKDLEEAQGFELSELGRPQLELLEAFENIPEMHDRLIAAEASLVGAPVVTNDSALRALASVSTIW